MAATWTQHGQFGPPFRFLFPPSSKEMQYVNEGKNAVGSNTPGAASSAADLQAQRLRNRGQSPKKPMMENNTVFASIFEGFGRRFGKVFGRFFGPKMHATDETLNCVKS